LISLTSKLIYFSPKKYLAGSADQATVEFVARYKVGGRAHRLHEISRFVREGGKWFYVDGEFVGADKTVPET